MNLRSNILNSLPTIARPADAHTYFREHNLDRLFSADDLGRRKAEGDSTDRQSTKALAPEPSNLAFLHALVRSRKASTVLEFGIGHSTLVLADAMRQNEIELRDQLTPSMLRVDEPFRIHSVDASTAWIERLRARIPAELSKYICLHYSACSVTLVDGRLTHVYNDIPNVSPDIIYIDGPSPFDVTGGQNGLDFVAKHRVPVGSDMLLMEYLLLPGTLIVMDGRASNARFLVNHLTRTYRVGHVPDLDVYLFELAEPPIGPSNRRKLELTLGADWLAGIEA